MDPAKGSDPRIFSHFRLCHPGHGTNNWQLNMFYFLEDMFPLIEEAASVLTNLVRWMRGENVFKKLTHIQLPVVTTVGGMPFNWYGSMKEHP